MEEYAKDRNGTRAAMRAGYSQNEDSAGVIAARLLADVRIQGLIAEQIKKVSEDATFTAVQVLREWVDIATADPSKLMHVRRVNCRYCWGVGHNYQWSAREYAEACDKATIEADKTGQPLALPDCSGLFGWNPKAEPSRNCPDCFGEGHEDIFFADLESLTGAERKLFAGVKRTKDGLVVVTRDQDAALANISKYLGMVIDRKELSGPNGGPIPVGNLKAEDLTDDQLAALIHGSKPD